MGKIFQKENVILFIFAFVGLALFLKYYPKVSPIFSADFKIDKTEALQIAHNYVESKGHDLSEYDEQVVFMTSYAHERYVQQTRKTPEERQALEDAVVSKYWRVIFVDLDGTEKFEVSMSLDGAICAYNHEIPDDTPGEDISERRARLIAEGLLNQEAGIDFSNWELIESVDRRRENRIDYLFTWQSRELVLERVFLVLKARVQGVEFGRWGIYLAMENKGQEDDPLVPHAIISKSRIYPALVEDEKGEITLGAIFAGTSIFIHILIFLAAVLVIVQKYSLGELGFKSGMLVAFGFFILVMIGLVFEYDTARFAGNYVPFSFEVPTIIRNFIYVIIGFLFCLYLTTLVWACWTAGDSLARESWGEKLMVFDQLFKGRVFFPQLSWSIFRGYALGAMSVGVISVLSYLVITYLGGWAPTGGLMIALFSTDYYSLYPIGVALVFTFLAQIVGRLFLISLFRKYFVHMITVVIVAALFSEFGTWIIPLYPVYWETLVYQLVAILFGWFFIRYDLMSTIVGGFVLSAMPLALPLLESTNSDFVHSGLASLIFILFPLFFGIVVMIKGRHLTDDEMKAVPVYVKRINEREQLKHELAIARDVQLRLLPMGHPQMDGFDIWALTRPAREVGGDYYDFIQFDHNRLGVVVGDVAGHGISAALVMAASRSVLRFAAMENSSTAVALERANRRLFRDIDRNTFVAIFYGVLNNKDRTLEYTNAGQTMSMIFTPAGNSCTFLKQNHEVDSFPLGMTELCSYGSETIHLHSDDILVFYTDGIVEARDRNGNLYGFERFQQSICSANNLTAEGIVNNLIGDLDTFVRGTPQDDDITVAVIRVR